MGKQLNMGERTLTGIYIYPVKSLGGIALESTALTAKGPQWDRRWMLVDENYRFLSQRELPQMTLLEVRLSDGQLQVADRRGGRSVLEIALEPPEGSSVTVTIWNDQCEAVPVSALADRWFSEALGRKCQLVYMPDESFRPVDPDYSVGAESVSFADGFPYLIIGEASLTDLNERLPAPIEMLRFRPNLVFSGGEPFEEDHWQAFTVGNAHFRAAKPCARCQIPTIDLQTGVGGKEPTRTLAGFRRQGNKIMFGMNACWSLADPQNGAVIRLGDQIVV